MIEAEEQLEAAIWQALTRFKVTCPDAMMLVETLMIAARMYAAGDSEELTALRREVLHRESEPARSGQTSASERRREAPGGRLPADPDGPSASRDCVVPEGATLSTGPDIPAGRKHLIKSHPQAGDK